jgi:tetratricopeptide (TPR) repeat protein
MSSSPASLSEARQILAELHQGRLKQAFQLAKRAMAKHPKDAALPGLAAAALAKQGKLREALPLFQKAVRLDPAHKGHQQNLLQAFTGLGMHDHAAKLAARLLARHPDDDALLYLVAIGQMESGALPEARDSIDRAIAANPSNPAAFNIRGLIRQALEDDAGALADFEAALALDPTLRDARANMAQPLARLHRHPEALSALEQALALDPAHLPTLAALGYRLAEAGRLDEARAAYARLLEARPDHAEALGELALLAPPAELPDLAARITALLEKTSGKSPDFGHLAFARAAAARRLDDPDTARTWYGRGNTAFARRRPADTDAMQAAFERIAADFPPGTTLPQGDGDSGAPRMVFVLGQPRSGTTLTAQVLSAHPDAVTLGENIAAERLVRAHLAAGGAFDPSAFARGYLASLPPAALSAKVAVDKLPANAIHLGYLAAAFPSARFVHTARDPRDVALSMWRSFFSSPALDYTFDMAAMAAAANLHARAMAHWVPMLGDRLLTMPYEAMVADIDAAAHALATHAGLAFDAAMTRPDQNRAPVQTASLAQVRAPVHGHSVGLWRAEAETLAPFLAGLDPALWPDLTA